MSIKIDRARKLSAWGTHHQTFAARIKSLGELVDVLTAAQIAYAVDNVCQANYNAGRSREAADQRELATPVYDEARLAAMRTGL